jgi:hypothetical protein
VKPSRDGQQEAADTGGLDRTGTGRRSRRGLLTAGAAVIGLAAAETMGSAAPAQASNGQPVLLGALNIATASTEIEAQSGGAAASLADGNTGVVGAGNSVGVQGSANPGSNGDGVLGLADGTGSGIIGTAGASSIGLGVGVHAEHSSGGTALQVDGTAVFSNSGTLTITAGTSAVTKTGIALTAASLILATLQNNVPGTGIQSAVPDVSKNSFTIHLNKAVPVSTTVAWFIVN